jgi:hypothetical protein
MSLNGMAQRFATSATRNHRFCGNGMFFPYRFSVKWTMRPARGARIAGLLH